MQFTIFLFESHICISIYMNGSDGNRKCIQKNQRHTRTYALPHSHWHNNMHTRAHIHLHTTHTHAVARAHTCTHEHTQHSVTTAAATTTATTIIIETQQIIKNHWTFRAGTHPLKMNIHNWNYSSKEDKLRIKFKKKSYPFNKTVRTWGHGRVTTQEESKYRQKTTTKQQQKTNS